MSTKIRVIIAAAIYALVGIVSVSGGTLTVNSSQNSSGCDGVLSFSEALALGRGENIESNRSTMTNGERQQISGATVVLAPTQPACDLGTAWIIADGVGSNSADDIVFSVNSTSSGPIDLGKNDDINGALPNGNRYLIDGTGSSTVRPCVRLADDSGSQLRNLELRNCTGAGVFGQATNGAIFEGLSIHNNAGEGISLGFSTSLAKNVRNVRIGGDQPQHRNLIFSNGANGILIVASATQDRAVQNINILNNLIGTSNGTTDNGNSGAGVVLTNTIGVNIGDTGGTTRNIISGNNNDGITISGSGAVTNSVFGNFIGVDESGGVALGNSASGVALLNGAGQTVNFINTSPNKIGIPSQRNIISANNFGVFIADGGTSNNWVKNNVIGSNGGGNGDLGNAADGVWIGAGASNNEIGGTAANEDNLIAFNNSGIRIEGGNRNKLRRNRMFANDNLGIDLGAFGVTANDTGDGDSGANELQNFPIITYAMVTSSTVRLKGSLNSVASKPFVIEFFGNDTADTSFNGEGRNYLGEVTVNTNGSGNATFDVTFNVSSATTSQFVSATATDENGNTSEFSGVRNKCADVDLNPFSLLANSNAFTGTFTVSRSTGCSAVTPTSNASWITVNSFVGGTVSYSITANTGAARNSSVAVNYNNGSFFTFANFNIFQDAGVPVQRAPFDFDGDGKTDVSIFRPTGNQWWYLRSSDGANRVFEFGTSTDRLAPVDYTGDGKADIGFWRPSTGQWFVLRSEDSTFYAFPFGANGDVPIPGDFDGDNKADAAVFRPSAATWFISRSSGGTTIQAFGLSSDIPVRGDYDGDGKSDIAIFRPSNSQWWILRSSNNSTSVAAFGTSTDKLVPGDYTGDGKTDVAFWRPSTGQWFVMRSEDQSFYAVPFGLSTDLPVTGDYDGDGKFDTAVFRPSNNTWYIQRSTAGTAFVQFGLTGDKLVPSAFIP